MMFSGSENVFLYNKGTETSTFILTFIMSLDLHGPLGYML
jgi:hypothetical protein